MKKTKRKIDAAKSVKHKNSIDVYVLYGILLLEFWLAERRDGMTVFVVALLLMTSGIEVCNVFNSNVTKSLTNCGVLLIKKDVNV